MERLIAQFAETGRVKAKIYQRTRFANRYTADVDLVAHVDSAVLEPFDRQALVPQSVKYGFSK